MRICVGYKIKRKIKSTKINVIKRSKLTHKEKNKIKLKNYSSNCMCCVSKKEEKKKRKKEKSNA